jgi:hypothetical protein
MAFVVLQNLHSAALVTNSPVEGMAKMIKILGQDQMMLVLHHQAAEETRNLYYLWEEAQLGLGLILAGFLYFATQKRILAVVLCGIMFTLVVFQYFAITPELSFRGRDTDFMPGGIGSGPAVVRTLLLYQLLVASEGLKLVVGGVLASYLFALRTSRKRSSRQDVDSIDHADYGHVDR